MPQLICKNIANMCAWKYTNILTWVRRFQQLAQTNAIICKTLMAQNTCNKILRNPTTSKPPPCEHMFVVQSWIWRQIASLVSRYLLGLMHTSFFLRRSSCGSKMKCHQTIEAHAPHGHAMLNTVRLTLHTTHHAMLWLPWPQIMTNVRTLEGHATHDISKANTNLVHCWCVTKPCNLLPKIQNQNKTH